MRERESTIRVRSLFNRYFVPLIVVVVVLGLFGGYLTYTAYAEQTTRTETRQVAEWESSGAFTHSATVVNDTAVYAEGEVLENRSTYFRTLTPRLDGSFVYRYAASDGGNLSVNATTMLVLRSVEESDEGEPTEYWRLASPLENRQVTSLSPGERVRVPFSVNVSAAAQRLEAVDSQFGSTPGEKQLRIETRLVLSGTRNGQPVEETDTYQLPISLSSGVYDVQDPGAVTDSGRQTEQTTVPVDPGPLRAYGGPVLLLGALLAVAGLGVARSRGVLSVSERERDWLSYRQARDEFDDWITTVRLSEDGRNSPTIEVETLEGLVDIAIDSDRRVLEDEEYKAFFVFDDSQTYVYIPPISGMGEDSPDSNAEFTSDSPLGGTDDAEMMPADTGGTAGSDSLIEDDTGSDDSDTVDPSE